MALYDKTNIEVKVGNEKEFILTTNLILITILTNFVNLLEISQML